MHHALGTKIGEDKLVYLLPELQGYRSTAQYFNEDASDKLALNPPRGDRRNYQCTRTTYSNNLPNTVHTNIIYIYMYLYTNGNIYI